MSVHVTGLRAGRTDEPFLAAANPPLSWRTETEVAGWIQAGAEIELRCADRVERARVGGRDQVMVEWPFGPLPALVQASLRVRVSGVDGSASEWSEPLAVTAPLADFGAQEAFITVAGDDSDASWPQQYRYRFELADAPVRAVLTLSGHGVHEAQVNGTKAGDEWLAPGWTPFASRLVYRSHDVTALLRAGANAIGVDVAPGWFGERYGFFGRTSRAYSGPLSVVARLDCEFADGTTADFHSSPEWQGRVGGPVTAASIYHGEDFDARLADPDWAAAEGDGWQPCAVVEADPVVLQPASAPPVRVTEVRQPAAIWTTGGGHTMVDFGENCVGVAEITVTGPAGHTVTLRHCEELEFGEPAYGPLRTARATDTYTLTGKGIETWHPRFTFHGFRYLELIDWPEAPDAANLRLLVLHTDQRRIGAFECSNPLVNQLFANAVRGWRGNSLAVPTDCPQRDERLGWTGDLQVFVPAASSVYDVDGFIASWLTDLALEQDAAGAGVVPVIVPAVLAGHNDPVAGWGDVATVAPWTLYQHFGDRAVLAQQYDSMVAWVECVLAQADDDLLWTRGMQIGDHLAPQASAFFPGTNPTNNALLASVYLCRSLGIMADTATALRRERDAEAYRRLAQTCRSSIFAEYVTPRGRTVSDSISSYAMLVTFGLVDGELARAMGERMTELVAEVDFRIGTGFLGTPLVMDALVATGQLDTAARLLTQTECPSWLYPVTQGATTVWERWDTRAPDGRIAAEDLGSFNHYALGAVSDWLQRGLGGLTPIEPGYRRVRIAPVVLPGFTDAGTSIRTPYGTTSVHWQRAGGYLVVEATVPPNATAEVVLPDGIRAEAGSGNHRWECAVPVMPAGAPGAVSMDTTLEALVRDEEARAVVVAGLDPHDPGRAHVVRHLVKWTPGVPLHAALMFAHPDGLAAVEAGLSDLSGRRLAQTSSDLNAAK